MQVELIDIQCAIDSGHNVLISDGDSAARTALARFIHAQSRQRHGPMIVLGNTWTSLPPKECMSHGCTLFFEELAGLEEPAQDELMGLLSFRHPFRDHRRQTRIISATAYNLRDPLPWFNPDLFYRLNIIHVALGKRTPISAGDADRHASPSLAMIH